MELRSPKPARATVEEYLRLESSAIEKHEYRDGEIISMAGGTYEHSLIIMNAGASLHALLKGNPCRVLESNMRVRVPRTPLYVYPDLTVICGKPQFDSQDAGRATVTNPRVIIEVLSDATEGYDRGEKFDRYRRLDSLEEYVLVSQAAPRVETFFRQPQGMWLFNAVSGLETKATLRSLRVELALAEVYSGIDFTVEP